MSRGKTNCSAAPCSSSRPFWFHVRSIACHHSFMCAYIVGSLWQSSRTNRNPQPPPPTSIEPSVNNSCSIHIHMDTKRACNSKTKIDACVCSCCSRILVGQLKENKVLFCVIFMFVSLSTRLANNKNGDRHTQLDDNCLSVISYGYGWASGWTRGWTRASPLPLAICPDWRPPPPTHAIVQLLTPARTRERILLNY